MKRAGELKLVRTLAKDFKPTRANDKFHLAADEIRSTGPDAVERAFMARQLVQCTLPHANPGDVPVWSRKNGYLTLSIVPAVDRKTGKTFGYPYGSIPRLLLFWIVTTAIQQRERCLTNGANPRRLELGHNLAKFMREVGLDPNTGRGKNSDAKRLREQMQRLFRAVISFDVEMHDGNREGEAWLDMQVAPEGVLWWDHRNPDQSILWGSWIELGEKFYNAITAFPVPVDMRALRALKRSPLALDLYALMAFKLYVANQRNESQFIDWPGLMAQLGCDYDTKRIDNFKGKAKIALRKVKKVFPNGLSVATHRNGITVFPGKPLAVAVLNKKAP